jgi:uncharacterized protein
MKLSQLAYADNSPIHGRGLFARTIIKRGTYIGTYQGPTAKRNGMYVLWVTDKDGVVTARSGRNLLRYLNHAARPNAAFEGFDLFAKRTVRVDEELTIDYGWDEEE